MQPYKELPPLYTNKGYNTIQRLQFLIFSNDNVSRLVVNFGPYSSERPLKTISSSAFASFEQAMAAAQSQWEQKRAEGYVCDPESLLLRHACPHKQTTRYHLRCRICLPDSE